MNKLKQINNRQLILHEASAADFQMLWNKALKKTGIRLVSHRMEASGDSCIKITLFPWSCCVTAEPNGTTSCEFLIESGANGEMAALDRHLDDIKEALNYANSVSGIIRPHAVCTDISQHLVPTSNLRYVALKIVDDSTCYGNPISMAARTLEDRVLAPAADTNDSLFDYANRRLQRVVDQLLRAKNDS